MAYENELCPRKERQSYREFRLLQTWRRACPSSAYGSLPVPSSNTRNLLSDCRGMTRKALKPREKQGENKEKIYVKFPQSDHNCLGRWHGQAARTRCSATLRHITHRDVTKTVCAVLPKWILSPRWRSQLLSKRSFAALPCLSFPIRRWKGFLGFELENDIWGWDEALMA